MTKTTFTIQTKSLTQMILAGILLAPIGVAGGMLANHVTDGEKTMIVFICLAIMALFSRFLEKLITTTVFYIIVDDQMLSIEEKISNGNIKYYTVNLTDIHKLYYIDHTRDREIISLKIKLVDSNNQTKLKIRSSIFESDKGWRKKI